MTLISTPKRYCELQLSRGTSKLNLLLLWSVIHELKHNVLGPRSEMREALSQRSPHNDRKFNCISIIPPCGSNRFCLSPKCIVHVLCGDPALNTGPTITLYYALSQCFMTCEVLSAYIIASNDTPRCHRVQLFAPLPRLQNFSFARSF